MAGKQRAVMVKPKSKMKTATKIALGTGAGIVALKGLSGMFGDDDSPEQNLSLTGSAATADSSYVPGVLTNLNKTIAEDKLAAGAGSVSVTEYRPSEIDTSMLRAIKEGMERMMTNEDSRAAVKSQLELSDRMASNAQTAALDLFGRAFGLGNGQVAANAIAENSRLKDTYDKYTAGLEMLSNKDKDVRKQGALILNTLIGGDTVEKYSATLAGIAKNIFDANAHNTEIRNRFLAAGLGQKEKARLEAVIRARLKDIGDQISVYEKLPYSDVDRVQKKQLESDYLLYNQKLKELLNITPAVSQ